MAGLYIHVPFCHAKCYYCDFYSLPRIHEFGNRYVDAVIREWELRKNEIDDIKTIYLGGGTPSILSGRQFGLISECLLSENSVREFTIEINPEDVTSEKIDIWKSCGVNRVSMGIQSLEDNELRNIGRRHNAQQAEKAVDLLMASFDNVSVDVIMALPGQTLTSFRNTLNKIVSKKPQHISAYILSYEKGTKLSILRDQGAVKPVDDESAAAMYTLACNYLRDAGYQHYEISNFAITGFKAIHNSAYWQNEPYLGLGPGAHSFDGDLRRINPSNINGWLKHIENNQVAYSIEQETEIERANDYIMVRLRTQSGLNLSHLNERLRRQVKANIALLPKGRVLFDGENVRIPEEQWLLSDDTISRIFI